MKRIYLYFLLIFISVIPLLDLLHLGLPITHDGQDHVARIANFYQNLTEGILIPRWAANLNWGYGHPILMFLYPLSSYFSSLIHFVGFSFVDSLKIVFALSFITSGLTMYLWTKEFLDEKGAFIAGLLYIFAPYRFVDLYVRGAIGEHVAFVFPPLILFFLLKLSQKAKKSYVVGASLSLSGLILAHNAISLMFLPIIVLDIIYLYIRTKQNKNFLTHIVAALILGFGMSAFFWLPALMEGKFTLRDIVISHEYASRFVNISQLFLGKWNYGISGEFTVQIGIIQWVLVILSLVSLRVAFKKNKNLFILSLGILSIFLLSLFIMLPQSKFLWDHITTIQKFQFPWRFLSISVFCTALLAGITVYLVAKKIQLIVFIIVVGLTIIIYKDFWHAKGYLKKPESFYTSVYNSTTDTGESAPIWSVRFMEKKPKARIEIIEGKGAIKQKQRQATNHLYQINAESMVRVRENTLYFPGWVVLVDEKQVDVQFQDPLNRGLMTFYVPMGSHTIDIKFRDTKLRLIADIISLLSVLGLAIYCIMNSKRLWQRFRLF